MVSNKPHIALNRLNIEPPRHKNRGGGGEKPKRNNVEHGKLIKQKIREIREEYEKDIEEVPPAIKPVLVVKIDAEQRLSEDDIRRSDLMLLDEIDDKQFIVLSEDKLSELEKRVDKYSTPMEPDRVNPSYNWLASVKGDINRLSTEDKLGAKLKNIAIEPEEMYLLDIEFWFHPDGDEMQDRIEKLRTFVSNNNGKVLDVFNQRSLAMARISILGKHTKPLFRDNTIRHIDLPPEPDLSISQAIRTDLSDLSDITNVPANTESICVIDSGIATGHPLLSIAIGDTASFPASLGSSKLHSHGTVVAGIALYGDIENYIERKRFEPDLNLFSARVLNENNRFDDDHLIVTLMEEAIRFFHLEYKCRVFNISIGDPSLIYGGGKPSGWSHLLDSLVAELNILIVVSAGNLSIKNYTNASADKIYKTYPNYLLDGLETIGDTRMIEPASAANVLTVGSLAHRVQSYTAARYPNDVDIQPIAKTDTPSPFTRIGLGVNDAIKPDVCEYGGNMLWHGRTGRIAVDEQLNIVSMNADFLSGNLFATDLGTSMAAPKIAHLGASLFKQYPQISANLVRALIANSSTVPEAVYEYFDKNKQELEILKLCGYGKPEYEKALYSSDNRVTLFAEEEAILDTIQLFEIPIPEEFQQLNGKRRISISLAYDPPVRNTRREYLGVNMEFRLFRGVTAKEIQDWYATRGEDAENKTTGSKQCDVKPGITMRNKGTLQKGVFEASRNNSFTDYTEEHNNFYLLVICQAKWATKDHIEKQPYAVAITIEHENEEISLYNLIQQRLQSRSRVRIRRS